MHLQASDGILLLTFPHLAAAGVTHGISTRLGGVSAPPFDALNLSLAVGDAPEHVAANRRRWATALGVAPDRVAQPRLVHGAAVVSLRAPEDAPGVDRPLDIRADGAVTDCPGVALLMTFADCLPILLVDQRTGAIGLAHAGWRGTLAGIATATVEAMAQAFGTRPADLLVGLGPGIRACCYEIGPDVVAAAAHALPDAAAEVLVQEDGAVRMDLVAANRRLLERAGVDPAAIADAGLCTRCHHRLFFSHRAARGPTGRGAALIARP
ncbi:MAG: peptidoglycan editing factor PgeF [Chloroflexi bacterium]|nr:peptidoglycan editing factor PgeF [Chloroflexota bacterium]